MPDEISRALLRDRDTDLPITVHVLQHGLTRCALRGIPGTWPEGHRWVSFEAVELQHTINCPGCLAKEWIFTFGPGHVYPGTEESLANAFVRIAGSYYEARGLMFSVFGPKWAHQYATEEEAGVERFGLTELDVDFSDAIHPMARERVEHLVPMELHDEYCSDITVQTCFNLVLANGGTREDALIDIAKIGADQRRSLTAAYDQARADARSLYSTADFVELAQAVLAWRLQGHISSWKTPASVALARFADELHARHPELVTDEVKALSQRKTGE
jgi:hypothetical protein